MTQNELKLSKDLGDIGDQLSEKPIYIYHIPKVKIGSAYNVSNRVRAQGYDIGRCRNPLDNPTSYNVVEPHMAH